MGKGPFLVEISYFSRPNVVRKPGLGHPCVRHSRRRQWGFRWTGTLWKRNSRRRPTSRSRPPCSREVSRSLAVTLGWLLARPPLETCVASPIALIVGLLAVLPLLILLMLCVWLPVRPFSNVLRIVDDLLRPLFLDCSLVDMAVISLLAGLGEEMLFRGLLQPTLADWITGPLHGWDSTGQVAAWLAAGVAAVLFGLLHAVNLSYAVLAGIIGPLSRRALDNHRQPCRGDYHPRLLRFSGTGLPGQNPKSSLAIRRIVIRGGPHSIVRCNLGLIQWPGCPIALWSPSAPIAPTLPWSVITRPGERLINNSISKAE